MTRENAINILYGIRADNLNLDDAYIKDKYDGLTMAIKALEQEPVLDRVRAEIDDLYSYVEFDEDIKTSFNMVRLEEVQRVIDKYKAGGGGVTGDIVRTMRDDELVDHYREMEHLKRPETPDHDYEFYQEMVAEMAKRFVHMIEVNEEPKEAAGADMVSTLTDIKREIEDAYDKVALEADILSGDLGVFATMVDCIMDKHIKRISEGEDG